MSATVGTGQVIASTSIVEKVATQQQTHLDKNLAHTAERELEKNRLRQESVNKSDQNDRVSIKKDRDKDQRKKKKKDDDKEQQCAEQQPVQFDENGDPIPQRRHINIVV